MTLTDPSGDLFTLAARHGKGGGLNTKTAGSLFSSNSFQAT